MANEWINVRTPTGLRASVHIHVKATEDDVDVARRIASGYDVGTILMVAESRFRVISTSPPEVEALKARQKAEQDLDDTELEVGQKWVTKDPRRSQQPFEIQAVERDHILTDRGVKIQRHRLNRYRRL